MPRACMGCTGGVYGACMGAHVVFVGACMGQLPCVFIEALVSDGDGGNCRVGGLAHFMSPASCRLPHVALRNLMPVASCGLHAGQVHAAQTPCSPWQPLECMPQGAQALSACLAQLCMPGPAVHAQVCIYVGGVYAMLYHTVTSCACPGVRRSQDGERGDRRKTRAYAGLCDQSA